MLRPGYSDERWCREMLARIREDLALATTEESQAYERAKILEYEQRLMELAVSGEG